jgi:hypothetical protein
LIEEERGQLPTAYCSGGRISGCGNGQDREGAVNCTSTACHYKRAGCRRSKSIQEEAIRVIAKCKAKLDGVLKKSYTMTWDQCSQEVHDKLEAGNDWDQIQWGQSLHKLIAKIERICVGFNNHKQEIFNLVQAFKTLFLLTQGDRESVEEYSRNFKSLWDTVEAFG